ncbi:hypothetical protein KAR91_08240 [Candidatus Pacearchaeota archaeon]|nr:hypothetical protein [Candidatus Pacearchaeota archaeon]
MDKKTAERIWEACEFEGVEAEIYEDYLKPWAFGRTTTGIKVESVVGVVRAIINNIEIFTDKEEACHIIGSLQQDSMGMQTIIY